MCKKNRKTPKNVFKITIGMRFSLKKVSNPILAFYNYECSIPLIVFNNIFIEIKQSYNLHSFVNFECSVLDRNIKDNPENRSFSIPRSSTVYAKVICHHIKFRIISNQPVDFRFAFNGFSRCIGRLKCGSRTHLHPFDTNQLH